MDFLSHASIVGNLWEEQQRWFACNSWNRFWDWGMGDLVSVMRSVFTQTHEWRWESAVLGCCFIFFLLLTRYFISKPNLNAHEYILKIMKRTRPSDDDPAVEYSTQGEPSSSSSTSDSTLKMKYDVFLSFYGKDTRLNFTDHLYDAFVKRGITVFRDDEGIKKGKDISQQLLQAIEDSLYAVVVLSKHYAKSRWCLCELQKILESQKKLGRQVIPIFYNVDPSYVRHQTNSFAKALAKHEKRFGESKVLEWRNALSEVGSLSGWDSRCWHETVLIKDIVENIRADLCSKLPYCTDNMVGIDSRMVDMISLLEIGLDEVCFVGIWGMGGVGKTTLARVVYERISHQFDMCCFFANVRETSEGKGKGVHLQKELLKNLKMEDRKISNEFEGKNIIRKLFCNKKILLVLDDVNHRSQLENLAESPKWFGGGSRVIITTRDSHLLELKGVHRIYDIKVLKNDESLQLFSKKAFDNDHPQEDYFNLSKSVVEYAGGLPLALEVLGSLLCGRSVEEWEDALDRLKQTPDDDILQILKISYDALKHEEKTIFLDIACFFKGWEKDQVTQILKHCDLHPVIGMSTLIKKALLTEKKNWMGKCYLEMHDLLQEMGRHIVSQESPNTIGRRSRLWNSKDLNEVLKCNNGSDAIQAIVHDNFIEVEVHPEAFLKMSSLRLLYLDDNVKLPNGLKSLSTTLKVIRWQLCPLEALPLEIPLHNLVYVNMQYSKIKQLWNGMQLMNELKFIDLSHSYDLTETPNFSGVSCLEYLILKECHSLQVVHPSLGQLKRLVKVNLEGCSELESLPEKLENISLIEFNLSTCYKVSVLPEFGECMKKLSILDVRFTAITKLPTSLGLLTGLRELILSGCRNLVLCPLMNENVASGKHDVSKTFKTAMTPLTTQLSSHKELNVLTRNLRPISGFELTSITELWLKDCGICDGSILEDFDSLPSLLVLDLDENDFDNLPTGCFSNLFRLRYLSLNDCERLKSLPKLPPRLVRLDALGCQLMEPLSDRQLWDMISSLNHEDRHQTKYGNEQLKHIDSEYLPQRDFVAIILRRDMPSWFPNNDFVCSYGDGGENVFINVDIPQYFRTSEWSGIFVCLHISEVNWISWSSKAPGDDDYRCKQWAHTFPMYINSRHLYIMMLTLNEKTCWQHLRGHNNCLPIKITVRGGDDLEILGFQWRVLCKEEMEEWSNTTNDFNKITKAEVGTSEVVCLPDSIFGHYEEGKIQIFGFDDPDGSGNL